jgi:MoxR-like ATPase
VESAVLRRNMTDMDGEMVHDVVNHEEFEEAMSKVKAVKVSDDVLDYLARIASETRADKRIQLGASPRSMVHLTHCARAKAFLAGRDYVIPDDIKNLAVNVVSHRIKLEQALTLGSDSVDPGDVISDIVSKVIPPR